MDEKNIVNINLIDYVTKGSKVLIGYEHGDEVAKQSNIVNISNTNKINIVIPNILYAISPTFLIGLLQKVNINNINKFVNDETYDNSIKEAIRILKNVKRNASNV